MATGWMKTFKEQLEDKLQNNSGVTAIVSTRIYPMGTEGDPVRPYLTFATPLGDQTKHLLGIHDPYATLVRFQVDGWATNDTADNGASALMDAVFSCLDGAELTITGWGTSRLESDGGTTIEDDYVKGVKGFRGRRRYKALLVNDSL